MQLNRIAIAQIASTTLALAGAAVLVLAPQPARAQGYTSRSASAAASSYAYTVSNFDADIQLTRSNLDRFYNERMAKGTYTAPGVSWINEAGGTATACGNIERQDAPKEAAFYCPRDKVLYLDYAFLQFINANFGYDGLMEVMAHEYGHHIQNLYQLKTPNQKASEWQADCLSGGAMHWMTTGFTALSRDELAAQAYWSGDSGDTADDTSDSYSHGTGAQRQRWFLFGWNAPIPVVACSTTNYSA